MNSKNIVWKFVFFVILPVALFLYVLLAPPEYGGKKVKLGIDLRGGHSLIFEIRSNDRERQQLQEQKAQLQKQLAAAPDNKDIQSQIQRVDESIQRLSGTGAEQADLPVQIISILKQRIDPHGLLSLEWLPLGRTRFEVRMPAASKETQAAKNDYLDAISKLENSNLQPSKISRVINSTGAAREKEIKDLAGSDEKMASLLRELAAARDAMNQAQQNLSALKAAGAATGDKAKALADAQAKYDDARVAYESKFDQVRQTNISISTLQAVLKLYVSPAEKTAIDNQAEVDRRMQQYKDSLDTLTAKYPNRKAEIANLADLYKKWADSRQGLDDPSDLVRLIAKAGVLEFRIAPVRGENKIMSPELIQQYIRDFEDNGPEAARKRNAAYLWFPVRDDRESFDNLIVDRWNGQNYVLLANTRDDTLLRQTRPEDAWSLKDASPDRDDRNRPAVKFVFDRRGAGKFYNLTSTHIGQPMAILLDDEVFSAPTIQSAISEVGNITGVFNIEQVTELAKTLKAGSLPAKLNPNPVSQSTFGPALGEENLKTALKAGYVALGLVAVFMLVYYMFGGLVADIAMVLNLIFVMGTMSILPEGAVFTLPGIAGLILSIGMAVDSNVLIYERLREEQARGLSIRMAFKNAYQRAFTAIFDSHITALITCLILYWVGTEEVKGFAITLGLGLLFNLFTAVLVTRWIYQMLLDAGWITKPLKMLHLIRVPNINWMGKRYYFWAFSLATGVLGLISLFSVGKDIWGIEFSSGTQAIVRFKDDALLRYNGRTTLPDDGAVKGMLVGEATKLAEADKGKYEKIRDSARVEKLIDPNQVSTFLKEHFPDFQGQITRAQVEKSKLNVEVFSLLDTSKDGVLSKDELEQNLPANAYQVTTTETVVDNIRKVVGTAFGNALVSRSSCTPDLVKSGHQDKLNVDLAASGLTPITTKMIQSADRTVRDDLADYEGGVLMVVNVTPAISETDFAQRIREMRFQPDFAGQLNPTSVKGLTSAGEDAYSNFMVLVKPAEALAADKDWNEFAEGELKLVNAALVRQEAMETTNFDPAIASQTSQQAIMALVMGWLAIIIYLWLRFGQAKWGVAAVVCLVHDVTIMVGLVALSGWLYETAFGRLLMIEPFKIDLTMIAALLTIVGYSCSDTIVVFDRIRENRGKLATVSSHVINHSINQTLSRTLLTSMTVFMVVFVMYVWGGPGIHSFNYAMLAGVLFGTYSSIAVAAPLLMGFKAAIIEHVTEA